MAVETFQCPECRAMLRYSSDLRPGTMVRCPQCQHAFAVPDTDAAPESATAGAAGTEGRDAITGEPGTPPRTSHVTGDRPDDGEPRRRYPDDEDYPRPPRDDYGERDADAPLSNKYEVDLNKWFSIGSAHYSTILGPFVGAILIVFAINFAISLIGNIIVGVTGYPGSNLPLAILNAIFITPAFFGSFVSVCLKQLDGRRWTFADFFNGFQGRNYVSLVAYNALGALISLPIYGLLGGAFVAAVLDAPQEIVIGLVGVGVTVAIVSVYFYLRLFYFVTPLIMDRGFGPIQAMKASWMLSDGHFWWLFLAYLVLSVLAAVGACACYVGALFTVPLAVLVYVAGYMDMAGIDPPLPGPHQGDRWRENG